MRFLNQLYIYCSEFLDFKSHFKTIKCVGFVDRLWVCIWKVIISGNNTESTENYWVVSQLISWFHARVYEILVIVSDRHLDIYHVPYFSHPLPNSWTSSVTGRHVTSRVWQILPKYKPHQWNRKRLHIINMSIDNISNGQWTYMGVWLCWNNFGNWNFVTLWNYLLGISRSFHIKPVVHYW